MLDDVSANTGQGTDSGYQSDVVGFASDFTSFVGTDAAQAEQTADISPDASSLPQQPEPVPSHAREQVPAPPAASSSIDPAYVAQLQAQLSQLQSAVMPYLAMQQRQLAEQAGRPPITIEQIEQSETPVRDLVRFMGWQQQQQLAQLQQQAAIAGRSAASEQRARGMYSVQELGDGNDFDTLRSRYVEPLYQQNPAIRDLVYAAAPDDPATAEYILGTIFEMSRRAGPNPVAAFKAIHNALSAYNQQGNSGTQSVLQSIQASAQSQNARVVGAAAPGRVSNPRDPNFNFRQMGEQEFQNLMAQNGAL